MTSFVGTYVGLLRAINLAGLNKVSMGDLRGMLVSLGLEKPRTLLQSGNVVFETAERSVDALEQRLERAASGKLGVTTEFFVRSAEQWRAIIAANPFPKEAKRDPARLVVVCLKGPADRAAVAALQKTIKGREIVRANGREAYVTYPDGQGRSKLTAAVIEKHLGTRGTARNWNTVLKLGAAAGVVDPGFVSR